MRHIDLDTERTFENAKVNDRNIRAKQSKYYWATAPKIDSFDEQVNAVIKEKKVLEIGCSDAGKARSYARHCSHFYGVDLSDEGIKVASDLGIPNATFSVADAHKLPYADGVFDVVVVNGLLHHLDLEVALGEIVRVLKPHGMLCAREPLGTNPLFRLYRAFTPHARTVDERPFTFDDLNMVRAKFEPKKVHYFGLFSIASAFIGVPMVRAALTMVDDVLSLTPAKYLFWQFYGFFQKRQA